MTLEDHPKRSLADDPNFLASLADLDRGMSESDRDDAPEAPYEPSSPPPAPPPAPLIAQPPPPLYAPPPPVYSQPPIYSPPPAYAPPLVYAPPPLPPPITGPGRRPLIDLFPPTSPQAPAPPAPMASAHAPVLDRDERLAFDNLRPPVASRSADLAAVAEAPTYETFYGLNEKPFSLSPDLRFLYHSTAHDRAAQELLGAVWRREGVVVLTGEAGIGKTLLCRAVIEQLDRRTLTSLVSEPIASAEELLKTVLLDFGVISLDDLTRGRLARATRADLTAAVRSFLLSLAPLQAFAIIFLDGAHDVSLEVLEQLRVLAEAEGDERLLQIVLIGEPELRTTLGQSALRQLAAQVSLRCTLGRLARDEIAGYVAHRLAVAGSSPRVEFDDKAAARVHDLTGGLPRLVNVLCDRSLAEGYERSASVIDTRIVAAAADQLDLAPSSRLSALRTLAMAVALALLAGVGAAGAAYVFRTDFAALITRWQSVPPPPVRPLPALLPAYSPTPALEAEQRAQDLT